MPGYNDDFYDLRDKVRALAQRLDAAEKRIAALEGRNDRHDEGAARLLVEMDRRKWGLDGEDGG